MYQCLQPVAQAEWPKDLWMRVCKSLHSHRNKHGPLMICPAKQPQQSCRKNSRLKTQAAGANITECRCSRRNGPTHTQEGSVMSNKQQMWFVCVCEREQEREWERERESTQNENGNEQKTFQTMCELHISLPVPSVKLNVWAANELSYLYVVLSHSLSHSGSHSGRD